MSADTSPRGASLGAQYHRATRAKTRTLVATWTMKIEVIDIRVAHYDQTDTGTIANLSAVDRANRACWARRIPALAWVRVSGWRPRDGVKSDAGSRLTWNSQVSGYPMPASTRVSSSERFRAQVDELFASGQELGQILEEVGRLAVKLLLQTALEAEATEFLGRDRYARGERAHEGLRNGYRQITVKTTSRPITLERPKLRGNPECGFRVNSYGRSDRIRTPIPRFSYTLGGEVCR